ncbi:MAG TPA: S1C family serine protease [Burkholderiales bacterium]|nr:S1C family serine protease [Burkholderiales bacterium]
MSEPEQWSFPQEMQPQAAKLRFDLDAALDAVLMLRSEVPEDAFTAQILGTERAGSGVVIDDGLVLTIGYLISEASTIWLSTNAGQVIAGHALAYDQPSGFGLVQALGRLEAPALARGTAASCSAGDGVIVAGHGGRAHALEAQVFARREFAGYWEYLLDDAIFTTPAHPLWGGAAVIGADGRLLGIGSLFVEEMVGERKVEGNMAVPIDLLEPILDELLRSGRTGRAPRPWLGLYATELERRLVVAGLAPGGPAARAGLRVGDTLAQVAGEPVAGLADLFRKVWRLGPAGVEVPLALARNGKRVELRVASIDRADMLKKPALH